MGLVPGEGAVQELASASADPAFSDRVHAGRPHVAEHSPDAGAGEDGAGSGGEVRAALADLTPRQPQPGGRPRGQEKDLTWLRLVRT
jgi:hypothetical protein